MPKVPFFKDSGHCPKILDYTQRNSISHSDKFLNIVETGLWPIWFCCPWECNSRASNCLFRSELINDVVLTQICFSNLSLIHKLKF